MKSQMARVGRKVLNMFGIGVIRHIDDTGDYQTVQVKINQLEMRDGIPVAYHFGYAACPPIGATAVLTFASGDRSAGVATATHDAPTRPRNLLPGESMIYDSTGNHVYLRQGGTIEIIAATKVHITSPLVEVTGDITAQGDIKAGTVSLRHHVHSGVQSGSSNSGQPVP